MAKKWITLPPEPYMQIRNSSLIFYALSQNNHNRNISAFKKPTYTGQTTTGSRKRIKRAVDMLCQLSPVRWVKNPVSGKRHKHRLTFITLTIPGKEKVPLANVAHKSLLAPWLLTMKRKNGLKTYLWKVEFQKNGQLHYHITTPSVIHYQSIKDTWNNLLSQNGFLEQWFKDNGNRMPNSTDIHQVRYHELIQKYLSKEISKASQDKKTTGKIWDCSRNIKSHKFFSLIEPSDLHKYLDTSKIEWFDRVGILYLDNPTAHLPPGVKEKYNNWRLNIIDKGLY